MNESFLSPAFGRLVELFGEGNLLRGSCAFGQNLDDWCRVRSFISASIHKSGSILDIGAGNGFFLRCLQEWCQPLVLSPYGIDVRGDLVKCAQILFNDSERFRVLSFDKISTIGLVGLPARYDFVFTCLLSPPQDRCCDHREDLRRFSSLADLLLPAGRLILAQYGTGFLPIGSVEQRQELNEFSRRFKSVETERLRLVGSNRSASGSSHVVSWYEIAG